MSPSAAESKLLRCYYVDVDELTVKTCNIPEAATAHGRWWPIRAPGLPCVLLDSSLRSIQPCPALSQIQISRNAKKRQELWPAENSRSPFNRSLMINVVKQTTAPNRRTTVTHLARDCEFSL